MAGVEKGWGGSIQSAQSWTAHGGTVEKWRVEIRGERRVTGLRQEWLNREIEVLRKQGLS